MKKLIITTIILLSISYVFSQESERNNASFSLGDGISFSFNEGDYEFNIYGFIKPTYIYNDEKIYTAERISVSLAQSAANQSQALHLN